MEILKLKKVAKKAFEEIKQYQKGEKKVIKTGRPYIDDAFPLVNGSVITIAASSGIGKSYELATILDNIMNVNLNPDAGNYISLNISLEMKVLSHVLRGLNKAVGKSKKKILLEEFTEEEKALSNAYYKQMMDDRFFISQVPTTPQKYVAACREFLTEHSDKDSVFISADHIALFGSDNGKNKNQTIEDLIEKTNELKMEFPNAVFIFLSQMNSEINSRLQEKNVQSQPRDTDLYYSQFTFQVSDYVVVIVNPYKKGINEYTKINKQRYSHLEKYFTESDNKGRVSLKTLGVLFYHLLKCREADSLYIDIFAEDLNIPNIEQYQDTDDETSDEAVPVFRKKEELPPPDFMNRTLNSPDMQGFGFEPNEEIDNPPF
jgi:replicative DNA helicase